MGRVGLTGVRGRAAGALAGPVSRRTPLSREQVEALIGFVFLGITVYQLTRVLWRAWQAGKTEILDED
jgi:hypothetical protein